ncbi:hypothetical protein EMCG_06119 [[Emmonsia] crescens]|uniref:Uncharacterized protein n=1 Tax=[Emmonsia] crescens TaxID=73230 RepID=A0A0G2ICD9_9EURO|nr:hypothetical protein EMCG_06119 [Emmonsia crescens UAMH 3008]
MSDNEDDDNEEEDDGANLLTAPQSTDEKEPIERFKAVRPTNETNPVKTGDGPVKEQEPTVGKEGVKEREPTKPVDVKEPIEELEPTRSDDETEPTKTAHTDLIDECEREQGAKPRGDNLQKGPESPDQLIITQSTKESTNADNSCSQKKSKPGFWLWFWNRTEHLYHLIRGMLSLRTFRASAR